MAIALGMDIGEIYATATEVDVTSFLQDIEVAAEGTDDSRSYKITVNYGPYDANTFPENPLEHPIQVTWDNASYTKIVDEDINGDPVFNSAGDYFDPPVERDHARPVMRITRNEQTFDPAIAAAYGDRVNADTFAGQDPGRWKCKPPTAQIQYHQACGWYAIVNYEFELQTDPEQDGWKKRILDQGMYQLSGGARKPIQIKGQPADKPIPLDGSGVPISPAGTPVYLDFDIYPSVDFSGLGFTFAGAPAQTWS